MNKNILRANSIRGVYGADFDETFFERVGRVFPAAVSATDIVVASDHRVSGPVLKDALIAGIRASGADATDAGVVPKGLACYAALSAQCPLAYITASHLPAEWNGLKFIHADGRTYDRRECAAVYAALDGVSARHASKKGRRRLHDAKDAYVRCLRDRLDGPTAPVRILADHGNGTSALLLPDLLNALGFEATHRFEPVDGAMPNRTSEPDETSLRGMAPLMRAYDLGMAFDGDADRVVFMDLRGDIIDPERFAHVILSKLTRTEPGPVVANAVCGRTIERVAQHYGRQLFRTPTGMPNLVMDIRKRNACFGMERSSHCVIPSVAPWDDACAVAAYAAGALSLAMSEGLSLTRLLEDIPRRPRRRYALDVPDEEKGGLMAEATRVWTARGYAVDALDGIRVDYDGGTVLLRASNTEPSVRIYVEADNDEALQRLADSVVADVESMRDRLD